LAEAGPVGRRVVAPVALVVGAGGVAAPAGGEEGHEEEGARQGKDTDHDAAATIGRSRRQATLSTLSHFPRRQSGTIPSPSEPPRLPNFEGDSDHDDGSDDGAGPPPARAQRSGPRLRG